MAARLPTSPGKLLAGVVEIPARRVVAGLTGWPIAHVGNVALFGELPLGVVKSPQPRPLARRPVGVPRSVQIDDRRAIPQGRIALEPGGEHGTLGLTGVGADGPLPSQFQDVPVARRAADVFQAGGQGQFRVGPDGPIERAPFVQREGEHADAPHLRFLALHDQRQDARRTVFDKHGEHAELLPLAEMPPIDFQPFERLEKRRPGRLPEQILPLLAELGELVDAVDFRHARHSQAYTKNEIRSRGVRKEKQALRRSSVGACGVDIHYPSRGGWTAVGAVIIIAIVVSSSPRPHLTKNHSRGETCGPRPAY